MTSSAGIFARLCVCLLLAGVASAWAAAPAPVHVVKIISFDCAVCLSSDSLDGPIRAAVVKEGGRFVIAPLPRPETDTRERFYYVLRDLSPEMEFKTREALFRGSQELNYPLTDVADTLDWLRQQLGEQGVDWERIVSSVQAPVSRAPIDRAIRLVANAGAQVTPTYVLVRDGTVLATFDINSAPNSNLSSLRDAVLVGLRKARATTSKD